MSMEAGSPHASHPEQYAPSDLRHQVLRDAIANGHDPSPWATDGSVADRLTSTCSLCRQDAVLNAGDCEIDNLQDACAAEDLYRHAPADNTVDVVFGPREPGQITLAEQKAWLDSERAEQAELAPWLDAMPEWVWELILRARNLLATPNADPDLCAQAAHEIDQLLGTRLGADDGIPYRPQELTAARGAQPSS